MSIYDNPEWQALQDACDKAHKDEAKALRSYEKADNTLAVDDPRYIKARDKWYAARAITADCYKAMADLLDKYSQ